MMLDPINHSDWNEEKAAHLLNRAGFGAKPSEIERLAAMRPHEAVASLVEYEQVPDATPRPQWAQPDPELADTYKAMRLLSPEERNEQRKRMRRKQGREINNLRTWWLERMANSPRPLQEKMVLFWHGHFATSIEKVKLPYLMYLQNEVFRQHAMGRWIDLLTAASKDPAMLIWLDGAKSNRKKPNENFAREVMELFTLGEGNYSEEDIGEAARAFTGWSLERNRQQFVWRKHMHDPGTKSFLGRTGKFKGEDILRILLEQPQANRFITAKLWRFFASETLPDQLASELATRFRYHGQTFQPMLTDIFLSREFYSPGVMSRQIKSPVQWLVSTSRLMDMHLPPPMIANSMLKNLGQQLFRPPNVKGWDGGIAWINTNNLLSRYNYAKDLVEGGKGRGPKSDDFAMRKLTKSDPQAREAVRERLMQSRLSRMPPADVSRLLPEFQKMPRDKLVPQLEAHFLTSPLKPERRAILNQYLAQQPKLNQESLRHAIRLLMCTPEYQLT